MKLTISAGNNKSVELELAHGFDVGKEYQSFRTKCLFADTNQAPFMDTLRQAVAGKRVVEFGYSEGQSAFIFLCGLPRWLLSFDIQPSEHLANMDTIHFVASELGCGWHFIQANTGDMGKIPECDVLLVDSAHTYEHVMLELFHADAVKETIFFHDTEGFPEVKQAVIDFTRSNREWFIAETDNTGAGMMVVKRNESGN